MIFNVINKQAKKLFERGEKIKIRNTRNTSCLYIMCDFVPHFSKDQAQETA